MDQLTWTDYIILLIMYTFSMSYIIQFHKEETNYTIRVLAGILSGLILPVFMFWGSVIEAETLNNLFKTSFTWVDGARISFLLFPLTLISFRIANIYTLLLKGK